MSQRDDLLTAALGQARAFLDGVDARPVRAIGTPQTLREVLAAPLPERGEDPLAVIGTLTAAAREGTVATQGGRYFGFVIGGSLPVATASDWLVSAWDQNAALFATSPFVSVVEEVAAGWMRDIAGLPADWSVGFVTGGQMANFTALAAARHHVLAAAGWDVEARGLFGAPPLDLYVGADAHYTIATSLRLLGLGAERVQRVPTDGQGRMLPKELGRILPGSGPCIVCAQAGNVNTGAFDPLDAIADETARRGAWLHVDGAFGLWAAASPALRPLTAGIARADSVATDAHKWLNVPYDAGIVLCRHPESHRDAMTVAASYIQESLGRRDPHAYVPEESRRARAVPVYAALRTLGRAGLGELVERCCGHARRFAQGLQAAGYEILNDVVLNQVLVSFGDPDATRQVIDGVQDDGTCWCGGTEWHGRAAMRISVSSWATTAEDVERSLEAIIRVARQRLG